MKSGGGNFGLALGLGIVAAIVGALVWGGIAYAANLEIGWIAWIIGAVVGGVVAASAGDSASAGFLAVVLTVLSICGGKILSVQWSVDHYIESELAAEISQSMYQEYVTDAEDFMKIAGQRHLYGIYMVEHGYTEAETNTKITQEEAQWFETEQIPFLIDFHNNHPTYEDWKQEQVNEAKAYFSENVSFGEMLLETLGFMDLIFFCLAIGTAFKVGAGSTAD